MSAREKIRKPRKPYALFVLQEDMEAGRMMLSGKKRREVLSNLCAGRMAAIAKNQDTIIYPTQINDRDFRFIVPARFDIAAVFDRNNQLNGITIRQGTKQRTFERLGVERDSNYTFEGDGVGDLVRDGRKHALDALCSECEIAKAAREWLRPKQ